VSGDECLQRVGAEATSARAWKDGIVRSTTPFDEPCLKGSGDITPQWSATRLAPLSEATYVCTNTEVDIVASKRPDFSVTQPRLHCHL